MSIIQDIKNVGMLHFSAYSLVFLSVLAPGLLVVYMYQPSDFKTLETLKLLFLSAAMSLPILTINSFISALFELPKPDEFDVHMFMNIAFTFVLLYASILIAYLAELSFGGLLATIGVTEVVFVFYLLLGKFIERKKP